MKRGWLKILAALGALLLILPAAVIFAPIQVADSIHKALGICIPQRWIWSTCVGAPLVGAAILLSLLCRKLRGRPIEWTVLVGYVVLLACWWRLTDLLGGSGIGGWGRYWPPLLGYSVGGLLGFSLIIMGLMWSAPRKHLT